MNTRYLLISTDGYSFDHTFYNTRDEAYNAMACAYRDLEPVEWVDEYFEEESYLDDNFAILYCNGDNVYCWEIIKI